MSTHKSTDQVAKTKRYTRPTMRTVITPKEIRDLDQPCAFYAPGEKRRKPKPPKTGQ